MKLLVTGGCGFIGSHFVRLILTKYPDYSVTNLDKLTYAGNKDNLKDVENNNNYTFVKGDIADSKTVEPLIQACDVIVNFAAETHVDRSIEDSAPFLHTNIIGTQVLLDLCLKHSKKILHISTDEVYGSIEEGSFTEKSPLEPNSPYASSKAGADLLCLAYHKTHQLDVTIVRSSNNFGPFQFPEKVIPLFVTNLLQNKKVPLYGDGKNVRDWIYVQDNCEAIATVLHKGKTGEIYNISSKNELQNLELSKKILSALGKDETAIDYVEDRKGHDRRYSMDNSKTIALGWKPTHSFEQALKKTIDWYTQHQDWWNK